MDVLVICKYEENPIKNEGARVLATLYSNFFRRARADNSGVGGGIWPKFKLIQAFMHVLLTCKNEDDRIKNEGARVFTRFLPLLVYGDFSRRSRAANSAVLGPIWPNFELVRDVMDVLVTCKYEEDLIKNEGPRVLTTFSPIITLWELSVAMDTRVLIRSGPKPNAAFPPPQ